MSTLTHGSKREDSTTHSIKELEFPWEHDPVGQLGVALCELHIFEPLQMEGQDLGQLLYS